MELFNSKRLGLALVISLVAVACAAPTIPNDLGDGKDDDKGDSDVIGGDKKKSTPPKTATPTPDEGDPTPPADKTPAPGTPPTTPPPAGGQCAAEATGEACFTCCDTASGGDLAKADEVFFTCACDADCATACGATLCNGAEPSAACDTCVQQKCEPKADAACTSAACKAGMACLDASGCDAKQ